MSGKIICTDLEFYSFQLLEISMGSPREHAKYPFWWATIKEDFQNLPAKQLDEIITAAVIDCDNTKTELEIRSALALFIK